MTILSSITSWLFLGKLLWYCGWCQLFWLDDNFMVVVVVVAGGKSDYSWPFRWETCLWKLEKNANLLFLPKHVCENGKNPNLLFLPKVYRHRRRKEYNWNSHLNLWISTFDHKMQISWIQNTKENLFDKCETFSDTLVVKHDK